SLVMCRPPSSTLFPYTTLFRSAPSAERRTRRAIRDSALLLGAATGVVGKPFRIRRTFGRSGSLPDRISNYPDSSAGSAARVLGYRSGVVPRSDSHAVQHRGRFHDGHVHTGDLVLLCRSATRGAPRSQHPVLEVTAARRSHPVACHGKR